MGTCVVCEYTEDGILGVGRKSVSDRTHSLHICTMTPLYLLPRKPHSELPIHLQTIPNPPTIPF